MRLRERLRRLPRLLVVTAVEAERQAVLRGLGLAAPGLAAPGLATPVLAGSGQDGSGQDGSGQGHSGQGEQAAEQLAGRAPIVVAAGGVGPAAAAAATSRLLTIAELTEFPFTLVVSAGIAGGFAPNATIGDTVLAGRSIAADLGADSADGFLSVDELGFGSSIVEGTPGNLEPLRLSLPHAIVGDVLTVSTVTGTAEAAARLRDRYPRAVAEAMEGFGVATAASQAEVAFAELRTISNLVGPRDRGAWRLADALAALEASTALLTAALLPTR